MSLLSTTYLRWPFLLAAVALLFYATPAFAATLKLSPDTGVYTAGATFSVRIAVNTQGKPINAAEGELSFNPSDLSVVSVSKAGSIFSLWTREPEFSNSTGRVTFGGGSPSGYTGSAGTVATVTFRTKHAGTANVVYTAGTVLAADGMGTNVLSGMQGGSYTVEAATSLPTPEYVAPPNTPAAPVVTSKTHPEPNNWYREKNAELSWNLPGGVTAVRTLLDDAAGTIPTKVYEPPIDTISIPDLDEGASYFHIQYKNADGWGRVTHYRLAVDTEAPVSLAIAPAEGDDNTKPERKFVFTLDDGKGSGPGHFMVSIDGGEAVKFTPEKTDGTIVYTAPRLGPGSHTLSVDAFDKAGNSVQGSHQFTIESFEAPVFTEYPSEINNSVIPVFRGSTRPHANVEVTVTPFGAEPRTYMTKANEEGVFTFIPDVRFADGVYTLSAVATDENGAQSARSEEIKIAVQPPGIVRIGGLVISVLSVLIPLAALLAIAVIGMWYSTHRVSVLRRRVRREAAEAEASLVEEFDTVIATVKKHVENLKEVRKGKLTKAEDALVTSIHDTLAKAERRIKKEIDDIEKIVKR
jgi:hypothetical protein